MYAYPARCMEGGLYPTLRYSTLSTLLYLMIPMTQKSQAQGTLLDRSHRDTASDASPDGEDPGR